MNGLLVCSLLLSMIVMIKIDLTNGECCYVALKCKEDSKSVERCWDCTEASYYCGVGKCNVVGCNCDGGCRKGDSTMWCWNVVSGCTKKHLYQQLLISSAPGSNRQLDAQYVFNSIDTDGNGKVTVDELNAYVAVKQTADGRNVAEEFNRMDKNMDGFLTVDEIDG
ncbi:uncharacterized protein LOC128959948 [Oppia nitens]|uniref:uncharacterized protein LOC128959948 n=1 Tax=Oppia nitens TaxID=1686743 RepID=UPI0023DAAF22|nr:uncharacterized protein LOC128959948 [Oppia nitens]